MSEFVITTDGGSDLPKSYLKKYNIPCVYLSYTMDGETYAAGQYLPEKEFYDRVRKGSMPVTSQVTPLEAREMFEPILKEGKDILHVGFSSGLSGTCNSAEIAARELMEEYPQRKIIVVDSLAASLGQGLLVEFARRKKEAGESMIDIARWIKDNRNHLAHVFTVDSLDHLYRGGRVSKATAVVGGILNIKPILIVDDEGHLINVGKVRGRKKSLQELVKLMDEKIGSYKDSLDTVYISHGDCLEDAEYVMQLVKEKYSVKCELIGYVGCVIGSHSGPGTLALFFLGDHK